MATNPASKPQAALIRVSRAADLLGVTFELLGIGLQENRPPIPIHIIAGFPHIRLVDLNAWIKKEPLPPATVFA